MNGIPAYVMGAYTSQTFPFPNKAENPKDKGKEYLLQVAKAILSEYFANNLMINVGQWDYIDQLRDYSHGRQSVEQYINWFYGNKEEKGNDKKDIFTDLGKNDDRKKIRNMSTIPPAIAPKYMDIITQKIIDLEEEISLDAIDQYSLIEKKEKEADIKIKLLFGDRVNQLYKEQFGIKQEKDVSEPQSEDELNMQKKLGAFKLDKEIGGEMILKMISDTSLSKQNKINFVRDVCETGFGCYKDSTNINDVRIEEEYIDVKYLIIQYSKKHGTDKTNFAGHIEQYKISELLELGFDEEVLKNLAINYQSYLGNTEWSDKLETSNSWEDWKDFNVLGFVFEYDDYDTTYITKIKQKDNTERTFFGEYGKIYDNDTHSTKKYGKRVLRGGTLILGTDYLFNEGIVKNNTGKISYHAFRVNGKSIIERIIPEIDQMCISFYRYENEKSKAKPYGYLYDIESLYAASKRLKGKVTPVEMLDFILQTGSGFFSKKTEGVGVQQSNLPPIQELKGGALEALNEFIKEWTFRHNNIMEHIGMNDVTAGSQTRIDQTLGVAKLSVDASATAIKNIFDAYVIVKEKLSKNLLSRVYFACKYSKKFYNKYEGMIGEKYMKAFMTGTNSFSDYAISCTMRPTAEERKQIIQTAHDSHEKGLIPFSAYCYIYNTVMHGNIKYASVLLAKIEQQGRIEAAQKQQQMMQMDSEKQFKHDILKGEMDRQKEQDKIKGRILEKYIEYQLKFIENEQKDKLEQAQQSIKMAGGIVSDIMKTVMSSEKESEQKVQSIMNPQQQGVQQGKQPQQHPQLQPNVNQ